MATVYQQFAATAAIPAATNGASIQVTTGTNFPVPAISFDADTDKSVYFDFRAVNYGSGNLTLDIDWYADTAGSGNVVFGAQLAAVTPNTDTDDIETKALATVNTVIDSHLGTTNQRLHRASITISNLDSLAADDKCVLRLYRDADDATNDTMTGAALVTLVTLSYSDT